MEFIIMISLFLNSTFHIISATLILIFTFLKWNKAISNAGKPISRLWKSRKSAEIAEMRVNCAKIMEKAPSQNMEIIVLNFISK